MALTASWLEPLMTSYRVTVLDVGQGQCVILQSRGATFLVDCGGSDDNEAADRASEVLLSMGIARIDGLVLTHYDRDHAGGVAALAGRIRIDRLYLPMAEDSEGLLPEILGSAPESEWIWLDADAQIIFGDCSIRIITPETGKSGNESSVAVLFQNEKYDTLITGDMSAARERELLERGCLPDLELLVVGHHGSSTSTSAELLYRTAPDIAVISVGRNNPYGHPSGKILDRLERYGCEIYRTDLMGDIVFRE
jgi:competence protein ComEC